MLTYLIISWSGSMLAQANVSADLSGPNITIDLPKELTLPSKGRFESVKIFLPKPMSIVPIRAKIYKLYLNFFCMY